MPRVKDTEANNNHCRCPQCPVQLASKCVETAKGAKKLYCAFGKTECTDFDKYKKCMCPTCLVWDENNLKSVYYCQDGSADEIN